MDAFFSRGIDPVERDLDSRRALHFYDFAEMVKPVVGVRMRACAKDRSLLATGASKLAAVGCLPFRGWDSHQRWLRGDVGLHDCFCSRSIKLVG